MEPPSTELLVSRVRPLLSRIYFEVKYDYIFLGQNFKEMEGDVIDYSVKVRRELLRVHVKQP